MSSAPLTGKTIVVTRPAAQAAGLADAISAAGGLPMIFPLLTIEPPASLLELKEAVQDLPATYLAIFISPNAVAYALPEILAKGGWPRQVLPAAVGQGTVKVLAEAGIFGTVAPQLRFDSEALLALSALQPAKVEGKKILIFRGDGGRDFLADSLRQRGAMVRCVTCYRRLGPTTGMTPLLGAWQAKALDAMTVSSSEGLRYLWEGLNAEGRAALCKTPLFVPHARIAETAQDLGLSEIILTAGADKGLLEGLCAYNWQLQRTS